MEIITFGVVNSVDRSVVSVEIDSELEIGTVCEIDSTLVVTGELTACATVVDNVVDCNSVASACFGVVNMDVAEFGVSDDGENGDDGCVTSNG